MSAIPSTNAAVAQAGAAPDVGGKAADAPMPAANWDCVPHQDVLPGQTLNIGVVAFPTVEGDSILHVKFTVDGKQIADAFTPSLNPQTNCVEYWLRFTGVGYP